MDKESSQSQQSDLVAIQFDLTTVQDKIKKLKSFEETKEQNYIKIEPLNKERVNVDGDYYIAHFSEKTNFKYIGITDKLNVGRTNFGIEQYRNKDTFVGYHEGDKRVGLGLYYIDLDPKLEKDEVKPTSVQRMHVGKWSDNKKNGPGTVIISKKFQNGETLEAFDGFFANDVYDVGFTYEEAPDKTFACYYGLFDQFSKNDKEGLFYIFYDDETSVIVGNIEKDVFKSGTKFNFNEKGEFENYIVFELNDAQTEHKHLDQGEIEKDMPDPIKQKWINAKNFHKIVNSEKESFKTHYLPYLKHEEEVKKVNDFEGYYKIYPTLSGEIKNYSRSKLFTVLFEEIKKEGKGVSI